MANRGRLAAHVAAGALFALFLALKFYSLHPTVTDDWIYAYMARRVGEGAWPYRDFFFAHPPVHLLAMVPFVKLFGPSIEVIRALAAIAAAGAGVFLWRLGRRGGGELAGILTLGFFFSSLDVLRSSSHVTGTNLSLLFLVAGTWLLARGSGRISGLAGGCLLALAPLVALYTLPLAGVVLGYHLLFGDRTSPRLLRVISRSGVRIAIAFLATFLGVQLLVAAPAPAQYIRGVYQYHAMKRENPERSEESWSRAAAYHAVACAAIPLLLSGALGSYLAARGKTRKRGGVEPQASRVVLLVFTATAVEVAFLLALKELYNYYLTALHALLALAAGIGVASILRATRFIWGESRRTCVVWLGATLLLLFLVEQVRIKETSFLAQGRTATYQWRPAPLPAPLDGAIRAAFFRENRRAGDHTCPITRYLWHESEYLQSIGVMADTLRARMQPGDRILGDSHIAPLLGYLTGIRVIDDEADTNTKRFLSGLESMPAFLARVDRPELQWVVVIEGKYIDSLKPFPSWWRERFKPAFRALDEDRLTITLAHRRDVADPPRER